MRATFLTLTPFIQELFVTRAPLSLVLPTLPYHHRSLSVTCPLYSSCPTRTSAVADALVRRVLLCLVMIRHHAFYDWTVIIFL